MSDTSCKSNSEIPLQANISRHNDDIVQPALVETEFSINETKTGKESLKEDLSLLFDIPIKIIVELGRTRMTIRELLQLSQNTVVQLESFVGEPLNILINGYLIARGEVVVMGEKYGVRIADIVTPSERMHHSSRYDT